MSMTTLRIVTGTGVLFLGMIMGCGVNNERQNGGSDVTNGPDGQGWQTYDGSFSVSMMNSHAQSRSPVLFRVVARDSQGNTLPDYVGRFGITEQRIMTPKGTPAEETYMVFYNEWGESTARYREGIGGFVQGQTVFPVTFVTVRGKHPHYECEFTISDLKNPAMKGTVSFVVPVSGGERLQYTEIGRSYDAEPLVAGEPGSFRLVARLGKNSLGFEVQDEHRDLMEFYSDGSKSITPSVIENYSNKANVYGELETEFTLSDYGRQRVLTVWKTLNGMIRASAGGPFPVGPPARFIPFEQADLDELSPVRDIWAAPQGTYIAFEFGKLYVTKDGGKSFDLVKKFDAELKAVGHWPGWPEGEANSVCVVAGESLRCDCANCSFWEQEMGPATGVLCLAGHPNKNMICQMNETLEYARDISLSPSWGGRSYGAELITTGGFPSSGHFLPGPTDEAGFPVLDMPWAMAEDRVMRTVYIANRKGNLIAFTFDDGETWGLLENNLPAEDGISFMGFDERYRVLYVGTDQSGLWMGSVDDVEESP